MGKPEPKFNPGQHVHTTKDQYDFIILGVRWFNEVIRDIYTGERSYYCGWAYSEASNHWHAERDLKPYNPPEFDDIFKVKELEEA